MDGTLTVAIIAVVFAGVSTLVSVAALWYAHRADRRADEQAEREARSFMRDEERADLSRQATLTTDFGGMNASERGREYLFRVRNLGPHPAYRLSAWLVAIPNYDPVSPVVGGRASLMPGENVELRPVAPTYTNEPREMRVCLAWTDGEGDHEQGQSVHFPYT